MFGKWLRVDWKIYALSRIWLRLKVGDCTVRSHERCRFQNLFRDFHFQGEDYSLKLLKTKDQKPFMKRLRDVRREAGDGVGQAESRAMKTIFCFQLIRFRFQYSVTYWVKVNKKAKKFRIFSTQDVDVHFNCGSPVRLCFVDKRKSLFLAKVSKAFFLMLIHFDCCVVWTLDAWAGS